MKKKPRKFYYYNDNKSGLMVIVEKIRGVGMVKSYGAGHKTELDKVLWTDAKVRTVNPADQLYLSIYDNVDYYQNHTLSDKNIPAVINALSDYWKATGVAVSYNKLLTLMGVK